MEQRWTVQETDGEAINNLLEAIRQAKIAFANFEMGVRSQRRQLLEKMAHADEEFRKLFSGVRDKYIPPEVQAEAFDRVKYDSDTNTFFLEEAAASAK